MLDRWLDDERPAPLLIVVVLTMSAIVGFIGGGVLASLPAGGGSAGESPSPTPTLPAAVEIAAVEASCQRESGVDEASNPVEYLPEFVLDDDTQTAWQCRDTDGVGETLTFDLGEPVAISELGLIPGYAKVDPHEGTDWYPLNRRLTEVQWHFEDGDPLVQTFDPNPDLRDMQTVSLDEPRTTSTLTLEIVSSVLGPDGNRNNVAVTEAMITACSRC